MLKFESDMDFWEAGTVMIPTKTAKDFNKLHGPRYIMKLIEIVYKGDRAYPLGLLRFDLSE